MTFPHRVFGILAVAGLGVTLELGLAYFLLIVMGVDGSRILDIDLG